MTENWVTSNTVMDESAPRSSASRIGTSILRRRKAEMKQQRASISDDVQTSLAIKALENALSHLTEANIKSDCIASVKTALRSVKRATKK
jgi:hypothetical protein